MTPSIEKLIQSATTQASAGRWDEAERSWREVHRLDPANAKALFSLGAHAYQRGAHGEARRWLEAAVASTPKDLLAQLTLATVCRSLGDAAAERMAIDAALVIDPYCLPAMLGRADWFERADERQAAATSYEYAPQMAPHAAHWPAHLRPHLERGMVFLQTHRTALAAHLAQWLMPLQQALPESVQARWLEARDILAGHHKPFHAQCNQLQVPRLPAIPFFDRAEFPWLAELESQTAVIRGELEALLAATRQGFTPYIAYQPGQPVNQWAELNHSERWSAFHLWKSGAEVAENLERCSQTAAILRRLQLVQIDGLCPNVMFSVLAPGTHIPPHHGETNARLVAHLPLIVPEGCMLRVGYEQRSWTVGETLIFDDTLEHEARNDSSEVRVVLIFDLWNPLLSAPERQMVQAMTAARRAFSG